MFCCVDLNAGQAWNWLWTLGVPAEVCSLRWAKRLGVCSVWRLEMPGGDFGANVFWNNGICNKNIYIPKNCRDGFSGASLEGLCQFFCGRRQLHVGNKWTVKTYNSPVTQIVSGLRNFLKAILGSLRLVDREYMTVYMIFTYLIFNMWITLHNHYIYHA